MHIFITLALLITIAGCGGGGSGAGSGGSSDLGSTLSGSVTLSWDTPSTNSDSSPLVDLEGYKVYYGQGSENYTESVDIANFTSATISNLTAGTWCFATTTYDYSGNESDYSNEVCAEVSA